MKAFPASDFRVSKDHNSFHLDPDCLVFPRSDSDIAIRSLGPGPPSQGPVPSLEVLFGCFKPSPGRLVRGCNMTLSASEQNARRSTKQSLSAFAAGIRAVVLQGSWKSSLEVRGCRDRTEMPRPAGHSIVFAVLRSALSGAYSNISIIAAASKHHSSS